MKLEPGILLTLLSGSTKSLQGQGAIGDGPADPASDPASDCSKDSKL